MADYVTFAQIQAFAMEGAALSDAGGQTLLPTAASRLFDNLCEVPENFFSLNSVESDKTFFGDGTAYLQLDPYTLLGADPIVILDDEDNELDVPNYYEKAGFILEIKGSHTRDPLTGQLGTSWPLGKEITVSAQWGWPTIPTDVQLATIALAIVQWRTADPAFAVISSAEGAFTKANSLSDVHKNTIENYKRKYSRAALFA